MIYITYKHSDQFDGDIINNVWNVKCNNVEDKYIEFMHKKAKEINIVINKHWLDITNWEDNNNHLSIGEYRRKVKEWNKIKKQWNIDKFISEILNGHKEPYKIVVRL